MLGPLEVRDDADTVVEVGGARLRALLILLALDPGRVVPTARLIDALWEDQVPAGATNALQALVSRLRRAVPGIAVTPRPAGYQLDLDPDAVDVRRFERLVARGRAQLRHEPAAAAATLRAALELWRGPALLDVAGARFAREPVARLDELRLAAVQDRIEAELRLGAGESLVAELEALVVAEPLREPLVGQLMRARHAAGRPNDALVAFEELRARLADQLGTDPSAELVTLHTALLRAEPPSAHTKPAYDKPAHDRPAHEKHATNLRAELTSFVGRDHELSEVGRLLDTSRLTTLTGPGGAGKTRLAVEAARAALTTMPDGVWLVELAPVSDGGEVAQTALATLGLRDHALIARTGGPLGVEANAEPLGRLVAALSDKAALLVLDNCEHLVEAAAAVADRILGACPRIRIVATSREPLGITGEALWPVEPLSLPPADADAATAVRYPAVRLFADRAGAVRPGFAVTAADVGAVVRICRALDGMPLAIELAAARVRAMTPDELATRLDDRFRLLTGGSRTALPRHQTLRAVVDWSWELLSDAERALCRRLSVFAGGATVAAAEAVCAGRPVRATDVLPLLSALVDKSLLVARHGAGGTRYRMLETIRAYGQERLAEAGEREALRAAHAAYFFGLAAAAEPQLRRADQLVWLNRLSADHDNLHAAVRGAVTAGDAAAAVRAVGFLGWYWWLRGHRAEGAELADAALAMPGGTDDEARAVACAMGALLVLDSGQDSTRAREWFRAAATISGRLTGPVHPLLRLVLPLEMLLGVMEDERRPIPIDALDAPVDDPDPWIAATARVMRAHMQLNFGRRHAEAEADFRRSLEVFRELGERWGIGFTLSSLAVLVAWRGEYATAAAQLTEAIALVRELGVAEDQVTFKAKLAQMHHLLGDRERARAVLADARRDADRIGLPEARYWVAFTAAEFARLDGDFDLARRFTTEAADAIGAGRLVAPQARAMVASAEGYLAAARGDLPAARRAHAKAVAEAVSSVDSPVVAQILVGVADLALRDGDAPRAATLLGASVGVRGTPDLSLSDEVRVTAAVRAALGDAEFERCREAGSGTTIETVTDLVGDLTRGA
jgi:predicted ATPase/DNA-binding SARP family transcriptional activator